MIATTSSRPLLQVFAMPASLHFYRDMLGFTVEATSPVQAGDPPFDWAMLRKGDAVLMLNTAYERDERPAMPDPARVAAHRGYLPLSRLPGRGWRVPVALGAGARPGARPSPRLTACGN